MRTTLQDAGVEITLSSTPLNKIHVRITVSYNFVVAYQMHWIDFKLSTDEFENMVECLVSGKKSKHGNRSIWGANLLKIKDKSYPSQPFTDVCIYKRTFILGFFWVPAAFSSKLLREISNLKGAFR
ncbi:hypothetical protein HNP49_003165 [Pseudomonas fluvialis]|uniref:Uncharacterized protein n=1 Tax=Pseudomonas fluvialis TaxID=1793966 RepID=A0A7X0ESV8_9PSED|nr:hypothetical protein [Pseudomonas fluvialis]MBB6342977.1 hypothetical protein [Pseudomonas fluvialis]